MNYELCKRAGLNIHSLGTYYSEYLILASEVEALLANAKVVYGVPGGTWCSEDYKESCDNHQARLILVEEIKREPLKVEFESTPYQALNELSAKIAHPDLNILIGKRVKVTIQEVE